MERKNYIEDVEGGLIAQRFEETSPNDLLGFQVKKTFLGFTYSEDKEVKEILSDFSAFCRFEERESHQDGILEWVMIHKTKLNTPEARSNPDTTPVAGISNISSWLIDSLDSYHASTGLSSSVKVFVHMLFVEEEGTKNMKKAVRHNAVTDYPHYGLLPVIADVGNKTLTYETETEAKELVWTPYIEELNERAEEYFSVSNSNE